MVCPKCGSAEMEIPETDDYNTYLVISKGYGMGLLLGQLFKRLFRKHYGDTCVCKRCGHTWYTKRLAAQLRNREVLVQHLGKAYTLIDVVAPDGSGLRLDADELCIYRPNGKRRVVPYDEVVAVDYHGNQGRLNGWLTVRHRGQIKQTLPKDFKQAKKDRLTVLCNFGSEQVCHQVCLALQEIVEENKKAGLL